MGSSPIGSFHIQTPTATFSRRSSDGRAIHASYEVGTISSSNPLVMPQECVEGSIPSGDQPLLCLVIN